MFTNKTKNLALPQYTTEDYVQPISDFNYAFEKIDDAIGSSNEKIDELDRRMSECEYDITGVKDNIKTLTTVVKEDHDVLSGLKLWEAQAKEEISSLQGKVDENVSNINNLENELNDEIERAKGVEGELANQVGSANLAAAEAQLAAEQAKVDAAQAKEDAETSKVKASAAATSAANSLVAAGNAANDAKEAEERATAAEIYASASAESAAQAKDIADQAKTTADKAKVLAQEAKDAATGAETAVTEVLNKVDEANTAAQQAAESASNAEKQAEAASTSAAAAETTAGLVQETLEQSKETVEQAKQAVTDAQTAAMNAETSAQQAKESADNALAQIENAVEIGTEAGEKADQVEATLDAINARADKAEQDAANAAQSASQAQQSAEQVASTVEAIQTQVDTLSSNIETAQGEVDALEVRIESCENTDNEQNTKINKNTQDIADLKGSGSGSIGELETNVTTLTETVATKLDKANIKTLNDLTTPLTSVGVGIGMTNIQQDEHHSGIIRIQDNSGTQLRILIDGSEGDGTAQATVASYNKHYINTLKSNLTGLINQKASGAGITVSMNVPNKTVTFTSSDGTLSFKVGEIEKKVAGNSITWSPQKPIPSGGWPSVVPTTTWPNIKFYVGTDYSGRKIKCTFNYRYIRYYPDIQTWEWDRITAGLSLNGVSPSRIFWQHTEQGDDEDSYYPYFDLNAIIVTVDNQGYITYTINNGAETVASFTYWPCGTKVSDIGPIPPNTTCPIDNLRIIGAVGQ